MNKVHLYPATFSQGTRGVWAVMLELRPAADSSLRSSYRRKWRGALERTTPEHLLLHAIQEGLNCLQYRQNVVIHAAPLTGVQTHHLLDWDGPTHQPFASEAELESYLPSGARWNGSAAALSTHDLYVETTVDWLSAPDFHTVLLYQSGEFFLGQRREGRNHPLLHLPRFTEAPGRLPLCRDGLQVSRTDYRELTLQIRDQPQLPVTAAETVHPEPLHPQSITELRA